MRRALYMINKKNYKIALIVFICIIVIIQFNNPTNLNKSKIKSIVNKNLDILNESINNNDYDEAYKIDGIEKIESQYLGGNKSFVDFYCYGVGLAPSSIYYGFYYVNPDEPLGFQATRVELEVDGDGWEWEESNGDNYYYTEKIVDHWYYYEAGF